MTEQKVAVVTGASRGIGKAIAMELARRGALVIVNYNGSRERAEEVKAQIEAEGNKAEIRQCNVADFKACEEMFQEIIGTYGRVDILVNNAGMSDSAPFTQYTEELFDQVMDLNVKGVFHASRAVVEYMETQGEGVILSTSSMVSISGQAAGVAYPASKFAVNGMTISLARELGPKGIRVNAVAPGITETDMMRAVPKEVIDPLIAQIPLRRLGQPEDIANAFAFLASDEASYITGVILSVDGMSRA